MIKFISVGVMGLFFNVGVENFLLENFVSFSFVIYEFIGLLVYCYGYSK